MKVGFGSVVYKTAYKFHKDFIDAINVQDALEFDVILLNDDLSADEYEKLVQKINRKVIRLSSDKNNSIPENRIKLIDRAKKENYDLLILGDFDDSMSTNRISSYITNFDDQYCFFYNNLYHLTTKQKFFNSIPSTIEQIDLIYEYNFLGLSNTALNLKKLDQGILETLYNKQTATFDWMIYSLLLLHGFKGKRVDNCKTYYRIYDQNIAGETIISLGSLKKELEIKIAHYSNLIDISCDFVDLLKFYKMLHNTFEENKQVLLDLSTTNNHYWWGRVNKNIFIKERK